MLSLFRLSPPSPEKPSRLQRDSIPFVLADGRRIDVLRVRDPRARRIKLSVGERGARLTLPLRASLVSGERFLHEHRDWLAAQLAAMGGGIAPPVRGAAARLPLRDALLPVDWQDGRFARARLGDGGIALQSPAGAGPAAIARALRDFYEAEARIDIGRWLPAYLPGLPRPPSRIRLRVLSSQWGSLAPDGTLTLDLALVLGRPSAFEYVLVHELCHLIRADHSRAFWREVEARCPDWREARDYFHAHGRRLKADLHVLLSG
ncbi:MAG: M48 family metallopeptidase [Luteimonas sp.]|nr:M48 family metallopeptidase [Luteimonas sp.]